MIRALSLAALVAGLATGTVASAEGGDVERGRVLGQTCIGCHGVASYNNVYPTYKVPKIGGQNYEYMVVALKAYRDGERRHSTMELQAQALSDQDIEDVAAYFAAFGNQEATP